MPGRPPLYLFAGSEELLVHRAAEVLIAELRSESGGELEIVDVRASELPGGTMPDIRTGSLFGAPRALLIREAQDLPPEAVTALLAELEGHPPDATVLLCASSTRSIMRLAKRAKDLGGRVDVAAPREWDERAWSRLVTEEFTRFGRAAEPAAVKALLGHAGLEVSAIAEKVRQVAVSAPAGTVTAAHVEAVVVGHGNRGSFAVADAMCDRQPGVAVELLRGAFEAGDHPVMILGALAYRLRAIVAVAAGIDPRSVGLNVSAGQARRLAAVRRNFGPGELTAAYTALARADREIKGGELSAELAVERAVLAVATRAH